MGEKCREGCKCKRHTHTEESKQKRSKRMREIWEDLNSPHNSEERRQRLTNSRSDLVGTSRTLTAFSTELMRGRCSMFRSSATIQRESRQRSIDPLVQEYTSSRHTWYDGSIESVGKRLAQCNTILSRVTPTLSDSNDYLTVVAELEEDRRRLLAEREQFSSGELLHERESSFNFAEAVASFEGLPKNAKKWVTLETPKFIATHGRVDRESAQVLAADYVRQRVSNLSTSQMRRLTTAFQFSVGQRLLKTPPKRIAKVQRADYTKIDDQAIFLT